LEDSINNLKEQNADLDAKFKQATEEIAKGNEIIRKLQTEVKSVRSKLKLKTVLSLQQEKLLDERQHSLDHLQKELTLAQELAAKKQESVDELNRKVTELTKKVEESKGIIEDNNHVIEWLHKQLNEEALHRPLTSAAYGPIDFEKYASQPVQSEVRRIIWLIISERVQSIITGPDLPRVHLKVTSKLKGTKDHPLEQDSLAHKKLIHHLPNTIPNLAQTLVRAISTETLRRAGVP
jgi:DNA repair exonuclease SbcCD ATPase subunit